jgi:asparagine synthase (glutamine-hydrolysing)
MCGLFFVAQRDLPISPDALKISAETLRHRGPDFSDCRAWSIEGGQSGRLYLGAAHTRLSILDLDPRSNQPFVRGKRGIVYNGEIYNYRSLGAALAQKVALKTTGDTEVLFEWLAAHGSSRLHDLSGMWAFVYWDENAKQLLASRDRYGEKPLFYYHDERLICFSSTIKPIFDYLRRRPHMREESVATYLRHGYLIPGKEEQTDFENIKQVLPSHFLACDLAGWKLSQTPYFSPTEMAYAKPDPDELPDRLAAAVRSRLVSDRPVGLLLSGGVDSSLMLSVLASENLLEGVHCYYGDPDVGEDAIYAKACLDKIPQAKAERIVLTQDSKEFPDAFLKLCAHQEKPFPFIGHVLSMAQMYHRMRENGVVVALDGGGADEIFGGYRPRHLPFAAREAWRRFNPIWLAKVYAAYRQDKAWSQHVGQFVRQAIAGVSSSPHLEHEMSHYYQPSVQSARSSDPLSGKMFDGLGQALIADAYSGRLTELLWHTDRNAMMSGVENRAPYLDNALAPYITSGYSKKYSGKWNKLELRRAFSDFIELPTQWRYQKQIFGWRGRKMFAANKPWMMDIIRASEMLRRHVRISSFLDDLQAGKISTDNALVRRLLCVAGIEQVMNS